MDRSGTVTRYNGVGTGGNTAGSRVGKDDGGMCGGAANERRPGFRSLRQCTTVGG